MQTQIVKNGNKIIVKVSSLDISDKTLRKYEKMAGCKLAYLCVRGSKTYFWNGPSNVAVAGFGKGFKYTRTEFTCNTSVAGQFEKTREIVKTLQRAYSKIRYAKKYSSRVYENLIRTRANGIGVISDFNTPTLP